MNANVGLLILRASTGLIMLIAHGWGKLINFSNIAPMFADPIGVGPSISLALAVFAEVFCSVAIIIGLKTRWATVPLIITMIVAVGIVHGSDPWAKKELGIMYMISFLVLFFTGPGKYSVDGIMGKQ
tara:strand:+ start:37 stop:417 length:381 start_codon:yes stop_codon:yes gene_type:complete